MALQCRARFVKEAVRVGEKELQIPSQPFDIHTCWHPKATTQLIILHAILLILLTSARNIIEKDHFWVLAYTHN
jgi:hypothetical protein